MNAGEIAIKAFVIFLLVVILTGGIYLIFKKPINFLDFKYLRASKQCYKELHERGFEDKNLMDVIKYPNGWECQYNGKILGYVDEEYFYHEK